MEITSRLLLSFIAEIYTSFPSSVHDIFDMLYQDKQNRFPYGNTRPYHAKKDQTRILAVSHMRYM